MVVKIHDKNLGYLGEIGTLISYANPPGNMLEFNWSTKKMEGCITVDIDEKLLDYIRTRYNPEIEVVNNGETSSV